ncbi:MAG: hypothetical protein HUJ60_04395 [Bacilli bacterium]|nr:hypothetical protein [Bacilli bacterium]
MTKEVDNSNTSYACENTQERVFVLSSADVRNVNYGLSTTTARQKEATDYAKCMGVLVSKSSGRAYDGCSQWWLRSPYSDISDLAGLVTSNGSTYGDSVICAYRGFLPASRFAI